MAPATATKPAGLKKFNLGGIATQAESSTKKDYPILPDPDGDLAKLVADLLAKSDQLDALDGECTLLKAEITSKARPFWFEVNQGKAVAASSVVCRDKDGGEVTVSFQNRYSGTEQDAALVEAVGADIAERFFRQSFEIKVNGDAIPAENAQAVIDGLTKLFAANNAAGALKAKATFKPTAEYHEARHSKLTPEQNMNAERLIPCTAVVKTKGRAAKK